MITTVTACCPLDEADSSRDRRAQWRQHEDAIVEAYQEGWAIRRIQAAYGLWDSDLYRLLAERGIPSRKARRTQAYGQLPPADEIARQYAVGATATGIARLYGVSRSTIGNCLRQAGITLRGPSQAALMRHSADWEHLVPEIRAALRAGRTSAQIRASFPISERQLRQLRREHLSPRAAATQKDEDR